MNCPSRTDPEPDPAWNQNPNPLASDTTTRSDLGRLANVRLQRDHKLDVEETNLEISSSSQAASSSGDDKTPLNRLTSDGRSAIAPHGTGSRGHHVTNPPDPELPSWQHPFRRCQRVLVEFFKFVGPGFIIAVAYIDPGNYATDAAAGTSYRFKLLFMILVSNLFAMLLQSLCIKLSTVTGLNLAEMNRAHCPPWLNYTLYFFGEAAVIATDIAEVIGFAIALNLLAPKLPIVAGCAISIIDVMFLLMLYRPNGSLNALRAFEAFVMMLVLGVALCFCYQLALVKNTTVGEVFEGFLPSSALVQGQGLYQACGILGATVMPHSLYLGSGLNQPRLRQYDIDHNNYPSVPDSDADSDTIHPPKYRPSLAAIRHCLSYSIWELCISLFTFAMFINCAILIICGASLYNVPGADNADLFGIYDLLHVQVGKGAATVFAISLLLSGCSAGIVCTMAGQMISEGQINWKMKPWRVRLITRSISIIPSIVVAGTIGKEGLSQALVGSQVALSVILPVVSAPLIYYTCRNKYMTIVVDTPSTVTMRQDEDGTEHEVVIDNVLKMRNHWITTSFAIFSWIIIVVMNVANIVLSAIGVA